MKTEENADPEDQPIISVGGLVRRLDDQTNLVQAIPFKMNSQRLRRMLLTNESIVLRSESNSSFGSFGVNSSTAATALNIPILPSVASMLTEADKSFAEKNKKQHKHATVELEQSTDHSSEPKSKAGGTTMAVNPKGGVSGGIYEVAEDILHPLLDSTNSKLTKGCRGIDKSSVFVRSACEYVSKSVFFRPTSNTIAVHMWTHVYLGWGFFRNLYSAPVYNLVEGSLPPLTSCPSSFIRYQTEH